MNSEAIGNAIRVLNEALEADPEAINRMMRLEVPVNEKLAGHATIQVGTSELDPPHPGKVVRPLGLINGLYGAGDDQWGFIAMMVDEAGKIVKFIPVPARSGYRA